LEPDRRKGLNDSNFSPKKRMTNKRSSRPGRALAKLGKLENQVKHSQIKFRNVSENLERVKVLGKVG